MTGDIVQFILRAKDEASTVLGGVEKRVEGLGGAVGKFSAAAGVLATVSTAALAVGTAMGLAGKAIANTVEQLDKLAARTGIDIEKLQVLRQIVEEAGGDVGSLTTALQFLNRAIAQGDPLLAQLGIVTTDTFEAFMQLMKALNGSDDAAKRTEVAIQLMGRGSGELLGITKDLAFGFDEMNAKMRETHSLITKDMAPAARDLDAQLDALGRQWKGLVLSFQTFSVPFASAFVTAVDSIIKAANSAGNTLQRLADKSAEAAIKFADSVVGAREIFSGEMLSRESGVPGPSQNVEAEQDFLSPGVWTPLKPKQDTLGGVKLGKPDKAARGGRDEIKVLSEEARLAHERMSALSHAEEVFNSVLAETNRQMEDAVAVLDDFNVGMTEAERNAIGAEVVTLQWRDAVEQVTSQMAILDQAFGALWNGLQSGFAQVFANLTNKAQTFRSAVKTIFSALVQEVLAMLARIAAAKVFEAILNIFAPGSGTFAGSTFGRALAPDAATPARGGGRGVTINVSAMDAESIARSLSSPRGGLRDAIEGAMGRR